MKGHEKKAVFRFALIYSSAFFVLFALLGSFYYYEQRSVLIKETLVKQRIEYKDCKKFFNEECEKYLKLPNIQTGEIFVKILVGFVLALFLIVPFSLYMAIFSLKPIREANSMMDEFISHIVHDLNTPLSVISLNVNSLIKRSDETHQKKLLRIKSSGEQLEGMGHSLLAIVKDEKASVNKEELNLKEVVESVVQSFLFRFPKESINFKEIPSLSVEVDLVDLKRILENILSNAIKYNRENNPIDVTIENKCVTIKDRGIGIKDVDKVFDKYYREEKKISGTGLGLCAVASMAKRNAIEIDLQSKFGEGTTISLHFH